MKEIKIETSIQFCQLEELEENDQQLVRKAIEATKHSYSPYSHFKVGAALRLANGMELIGANQENAAYPVGLCAERTAIFAAQANYPDQPIVAIAITAANENGLVKKPVTPCGSCRQVMLEIEDRYKQPIKIFLYGTDGVYIINTIKDLMPLYFVDEAMH